MLSGRKRLLLILIVVLCAMLHLLIGKVFFIPLSSTSLKVDNVRFHENCISFDLVNMNSGLWINQRFTYEIEDGILKLRFYGTMIPMLAIPDHEITIADDKVESIETIVIVGSDDLQ